MIDKAEFSLQEESENKENGSEVFPYNVTLYTHSDKFSEAFYAGSRSHKTAQE